jgi:hypothetical protein
MKNPFVFGIEVSGKQFTDRKDEISEIKSDLLGGQSVILYSPRKYGKTSLVKKILEELKNEAVTAYIDIYPITSKEWLFETFAGKVTSSAFTKIDEMINSAREILPDVSPKISVKYESAEIEFSIKGKEKEREKLFPEYLEVPQKIAEKKNKRVIVAFDEFQEIKRLDGDEIERVMRSHFQSQRNVSYIFSGSKKHMMEDIFENKNKPFFRFGKHISLKKIPEKQFSEFIKNNFKDTGINASDEIISHILELTQCHPHYTQQICHEIWYAVTAKENREISTEDVHSAFEKVLINQNDAYLSIWDAATKGERAVLIALASGETSFFSGKTIEEYNMISQSHVQRSLEGLERKEVIEKVNWKYETDIFLMEWIKRRIMQIKPPAFV